MKLAVIGTGYVGLVAGTCFAHGGNHVCCVDIDERKIAALREGVIPIYEPGLDKLVRTNVASGRLTFSTDTVTAVRAADVVFIAVGTPPGEDGAADLSHVLAVARAIAPALEGYTVVVMKSTVPIGTCTRIEKVLEGLATADFDVASNPEFLKEGAAVDDFLRPERVVVGTTSERARAILAHLYAPFVADKRQILFTDLPSAEMTKYASNCMLAARISFMNEIAALCETVGATIDDVKRGVGADSRIGPKFLNPGIGYGGSCFPKDVKALLRIGLEAGLPMEMLQATERVNEMQKGLLGRRCIDHFGGDLKGRTIAMLGLAFKPETDDMREAPALVIAELLLARGARVVGYDPVARDTARAELGDDVVYAASWRDAVAGADAVLVATEWLELRSIEPAELAAATDCRLVFDGRNIWSTQEMRAAGFEYVGIGRP